MLPFVFVAAINSPTTQNWGFFGLIFDFWGYVRDVLFDSMVLSVPLVLAALHAIGWMVTRDLRRERRTRLILSGACTQCGYDLRGTPDSPTCPECGAPVPHEAPQPLPPAAAPVIFPAGQRGTP
jgi:hypothetical protein